MAQRITVQAIPDKRLDDAALVIRAQLQGSPRTRVQFDEKRTTRTDDEFEHRESVEAARLSIEDVTNRALMIHEGGDNYSDVPEKSGGGGARIACGIVGGEDGAGTLSGAAGTQVSPTTAPTTAQ